MSCRARRSLWNSSGTARRTGDLMNLNSILIGSEDPKRLADYYTRLFGEPGWNMGGYIGWQLGSGGGTGGAPDQGKGRHAGPRRVIFYNQRGDGEGGLRRVQGGGGDGGTGA